MSAYLSTTFWGTPTNLLASASSEGGTGGALTLGLATAALIALCVAARALAWSVERRRERKRKSERARKRREQEARAAFYADFLKNNGNNVVYATACEAAERVDVRERTERCGRNGRNNRNDRNNRSDRRGDRDGRRGCRGCRGRWERDEKTRATAERRRRAKARRAALRSSAFWTIVAASVGGLASLPTPNVPKNDDRSGETTVANRAENSVKTTVANQVWNAPLVEIRAVADGEGSRWANAVEIQDAENKRIETTRKNAREKTSGENNASTEVDKSGQGGENSKNSESGEKETTQKSTFAADAVDFETRAIVACRAVSESVDEAPRVRWVQTASGELTRVEQIRAESSVEIAPDASANAAFSENGAWSRRPLGRSAAQS
ncbi:MAG: hypothetical protein IJ991_00680, partial [Thermoguttaceae bacterium]|nr:hypothetical protein [Thermoguttaceae bacterium]